MPSGLPQQPATTSEEHPPFDETSASDGQQDDSNKKRSKGGFLKRSTNAHYEELEQKCVVATNCAAIKLIKSKH